MRHDRTNSETDAGAAAHFDAPEVGRYEDAPPPDALIDWRDAADPHGWPETTRGPLRDALDAAVEATTCQGCGQRGERSDCEHGKNICSGCWPDLCWSCQAEAEGVEPW